MQSNKTYELTHSPDSLSPQSIKSVFFLCIKYPFLISVCFEWERVTPDAPQMPWQNTSKVITRNRLGQNLSKPTLPNALLYQGRGKPEILLKRISERNYRSIRRTARTLRLQMIGLIVSNRNY